MTYSFSRLGFMIEPNDAFSYKATALHKPDDTWIPILPLQVSAGETPVAALLRLVTPLREEDPSPEEARDALQQVMVKKGISVRQLSQKVDYSEKRLREFFQGEPQFSYPVILSLASDAGIPYDEFRTELRRLQRQRDRAKDQVK